MSTLTISIVQTQLIWEDKKANLQSLGQKIQGIPRETEIVILPEMFSTGFSMNPELLAEKMDGPTMAWMKETAFKKKMIITGSMISKEETGNAINYFNRLVWMLPTGEYGYYDKRHLFAYAGENEKYSPGDRRLIASVKGWKINLLVCYDLRFPVWSRQCFPRQFTESTSDSPEYDLLIYTANWPEKRIQAWKTLLQARAIENQCYVVGANRTGRDGNDIAYSGDSMIIGPLGDILLHASNQEDIFTYTLQKEKLEETRARFPFWKDADHFLIEP